MARFRFPLRRRLRRRAKRWFNAILQLISAPVRRNVVLLAIRANTPENKIREIENRVKFVLSCVDENMDVRSVRSIRATDYVRCAAIAAVDAAAVPRVAQRSLNWVVDLDFEANPRDGWELMDLAGVTAGSRKVFVDAGRSVFTDRVRGIRDQHRPVYLFGTGPYLRHAANRSFRDGTVVVCNTVVRDQELWDHLQPAFLVAGDAIYHFGHSPHARAFRSDALRRLRESEGKTLFVYPAIYDVVVRSEFGDVESHLVPIPFGEHTDPTVDLVKEFRLPYLENVLACLLLPLGCTLSQDVRLWGFDGRAPTDRGFWSNSSRHSYGDLMDSLRAAHPAFFESSVPQGREVSYVQKVHGDALDVRLVDAERRGYRFTMLHPTWTATLQKRYHSAASDRNIGGPFPLVP
jgi:hypothetical protein